MASEYIDTASDNQRRAKAYHDEAESKALHHPERQRVGDLCGRCKKMFECRADERGGWCDRCIEAKRLEGLGDE